MWDFTNYNSRTMVSMLRKAGKIKKSKAVTNQGRKKEMQKRRKKKRIYEQWKKSRYKRSSKIKLL